MGEPDGAADLRPGAPVPLRDDVDEVLRVVRLRVALVRAEVGSVLEARLRDHPASDEVLVGQEAQLKSPSDHLPEETRGVQGLRLALVDDDRAVSEEVHDDPPLRPLARPVPPRMRLPHAVIRHVALLVHEAEQERLPDARRLLRTFEELREIEHRPLAQGPHPVAARRLPRGAAARIHLEVDGPASRLDHVPSLPQVAVDEVPDLERLDRGARGAEQLPGAHRAAFPADGETVRLDEVDRLEEIELEASAGSRTSEEPTIVERAAFGRILDHDPVRNQFPRHPRPANGRRAIKGSERVTTRGASGAPFRGVYIEAYTMKGAMKRDRLLEETREALAKTGFFLSRPHGERGLSFDLVARRDDTLLIVKVLQNVDALARETAHELKVIARTLEGSPLVVGERTGTGALEDGVIYNRFGVPI